ncbi:MAG: hypothetical protein U0R17_03205 [Acidimicrobiia bacterium]
MDVSFILNVVSISGIALINVFVNYKIKRFIDISQIGYLFIFPAFIHIVMSSSSKVFTFAIAVFAYLLIYVLLNFLTDYYIYNKYLSRDPIHKTIFSISVSLVLFTLFEIVFADNNSIKNPLQNLHTSQLHIAAIALFVIYSLLLFVFIKTTFIGKKLRAYVYDPIQAQTYGISETKQYLLCSILSGITLCTTAMLLSKSFYLR